MVMYLKKVVLQRLNGILVVFARIPHGFWFNFFFSVSIKKVLQLKKANYFWSNTGALIFNYRTKKRFLVNFGKEFFFFFSIRFKHERNYPFAVLEQSEHTVHLEGAMFFSHYLGNMWSGAPSVLLGWQVFVPSSLLRWPSKGFPRVE